jgi:hypothetical protein
VNDFNPVGQVRPEDVSRFFIDRKEHDRSRSLVQRLKLSLRNSIGQPKPYKGLLTGHVGSGKSSELIRVGQELVDDFFVVWFDAEWTLSTETVNHFEILLAMGLAVHAAAEAADLNPKKKLADELIKSLAKFVRTYEERKRFSLRLDQLVRQVFSIALVSGAVALGGLPAALPAGAFVVGADAVLKTARLELNVRDEHVRILELPANRLSVLGALNDIIEDVQQKAGKPLLIITDGLDKVPAVRAQKLFAESALLTEPACALIYAAPIEFYHRLAAGTATNLFDEYKILSNPAVQKRPPTGDNWKMEREPNEDGLEVMRKVIAKRLAAHEKTVDEIIAPEALRVLAQASGGVMRDLVRSFRDAVISGQLLDKQRIDETIAQEVVSQQRQEVAPRITSVHREALRNVLRQGALSGGAQQEVEDQLLRSLYLLSYQEASYSWFDAHPNVLPLL